MACRIHPHHSSVRWLLKPIPRCFLVWKTNGCTYTEISALTLSSQRMRKRISRLWKAPRLLFVVCMFTRTRATTAPGWRTSSSSGSRTSPCLTSTAWFPCFCSGWTRRSRTALEWMWCTRSCCRSCARRYGYLDVVDTRHTNINIDDLLLIDWDKIRSNFPK